MADLIAQIEALLPQTQCGLCGYAGCAPYAAALARDAPIDRCPPGGEFTRRALGDLLGRTATTAQVVPARTRAVIDEGACIGCALCLKACPLDAIVGAARYLHTVLPDDCSGCGLCVPACPVDCIALPPYLPRDPGPWPQYQTDEARRWQTQARRRRERLARQAAARTAQRREHERARKKQEIAAAVARVKARRIGP
mgnify:CR=1 FL=1